MFNIVREATTFEQLVPLEPQQIRKAASRMKAEAGMGIDQLSPIDVERLPESGMHDLAQLYEAIEGPLTWPRQKMACIWRLLPKKSSGDRVIGLLPIFCRIWSLVRD
eukprot:7881781-Pyramimonas_sp.AAC.1